MDGMSIPAEEPKRKAGQKMSREERASLPIDKIIAHAGQFIRKDYGGKDPLTITTKRAREWAESKGYDFTDQGFEKLAEFGLEEADHTRTGIQERVSETREELKRRIELQRTALQFLASGHIERAKALLEQSLNGIPVKDNKKLF